MAENPSVNPSEHGASDILRGRSRGLIVGSLIALGWAAYGTSNLAPAYRLPVLLVGGTLTVAFVAAAAAEGRRARTSPPATPAQAMAKRRTGRLFWLNLVVEVILLNVAINVLKADPLRIFWIPAISAVVGLHFFPMALMFKLRSYGWVSAGMITAALAAALLIIFHTGVARTVVAAEALANAVILWSALAVGAFGAHWKPINARKPVGEQLGNESRPNR